MTTELTTAKGIDYIVLNVRVGDMGRTHAFDSGTSVEAIQAKAEELEASLMENV